MKICLCNGGLGNQVFQYIFSRWMELATGEPCYLDDSAFWGEKVEHNGWEIPKVFPDARPRLLSDFFTPDVWEYMVERRKQGISICQQIKDLGEDIFMVAEYPDYSFDGAVVSIPKDTYIPALAQSKGNVYFHGYWINSHWLKKDFFDVIRRELIFAPLTEEHNLCYAELISTCCSLSVHVRRGDFVTAKRDRPPEAYRLAVECAEQAVENAHYFIFSDDLEWCKANAEEMGLATLGDRVIYVDGNRGVTGFRDMQLMSMCRGNILVGSSAFSYLAALLNIHKVPIVVNASGREL